MRGKDIVFLLKPTSNFLGIGETLDEEAVRSYFKEKAQAASGCRLEIVQRDVYLLHGGPEKVKRYVQLIRSAVEKYWHP